MQLKFISREVCTHNQESLKRIASEKKARKLGVDITQESKDTIENKANQIILSGTAYYDFNHFAEYWKKWKAIVKSKGDKSKLRDIFGGEDVPEEFDWTDWIQQNEGFEKDVTTTGIFAPWCMYKEDFLRVGGHDELFAPQSREDSDLFNLDCQTGSDPKTTGESEEGVKDKSAAPDKKSDKATEEKEESD